MRVDAVMWPDRPWAESRAEWREAEAIGIRRGWLYDHLVLGARPRWHEAYTTLAAAAAVTERLGLGTMVTSPNFRHPVTSAKAALSLHAISSGRFVLGVGAGGPGADSDALGGEPLDRAERTARFAEWTALARAALSESRVDASGRYYSARDVALGGGPDRPAIAVASTGRRGMRVAVDHADLWITQDVAQSAEAAERPVYDEVLRQVALLDEVCREAGRDPATLERLTVLGYGGERPLASRAAFDDCVARYREAGFAAIAVLWPRDAAERRVLDAALADLR